MTYEDIQKDTSVLLGTRFKELDNNVLQVIVQSTGEVLYEEQFETNQLLRVRRANLTNNKLAEAMTQRTAEHCNLIDVGNGKKMKTGWVR